MDLKPSNPSGRKNGVHDLCGGILYAAEDEPRSIDSQLVKEKDKDAPTSKGVS
jgi:hypothetical protein